MKPEGRAKDYQRRECSHMGAKVLVTGAPEACPRIYPGTYLPSSRALRHLTKQLIRRGKEGVGGLTPVQGWVSAESPSQ